jgi:hypothetical protein
MNDEERIVELEDQIDTLVCFIRELLGEEKFKIMEIFMDGILDIDQEVRAANKYTEKNFSSKLKEILA